MAEAPKLLYIVVVDDQEKKGEYISLSSSSPSPSPASLFRYSRSVLQSALQLMGCKPRHAFKICRRVFEVMRIQHASNTTMRESLIPDASNGYLSKETEDLYKDGLNQQEGPLTLENLERSNSMLFDLYKRQTTVVVLREYFLNVVCDALSQYKYVGPNQRADLVLACRIRERKESVTVLLCGTSGCGKSTLSALLGGRLGITTVVSTDSIRHMMRSFVDEKENPLLWSSTYHAGEHLDPVAVAKAKARTRAKKLAGVSHSSLLDMSDRDLSSNTEGGTCKPGCNFEMIGQKQMAVEGFKAQSEMVIDSLDRLITAWEDRKESVVVEGVHLSLNFVMRLMKKHPSIIPFMVYISNEDKHLERFAVRAKYMTLDPAKNKYVKYIRNIRAIQEYLCNRADKHLVPKINNTNVDRSVAAIHATVFSCLRRRNLGERLYDPTTNTVPVVDEEYRKQRAANSLSSKGMFQLIQRKGSSRHLMALLNTDGSVAKAWPVDSTHGRGNSESVSGNSNNVGSPMYGPLQIGKAEPVNLQFGSFGISAWPSHTGGTSRAGSVDESRADGTETGSRHFSSCCSSPRTSDGPFKEPKDGSSVSDSEEEAASNHDGDSDDDASDLDGRDAHEEMEGSVDEDSTKSDEEYEDLLLRDGLVDGYCSDDDEPYRENKLIDVSKSASTDKYQQNLDLFLRANEQRWEAPPCSYYSPVLLDNKERSSEGRLKRRSLSDSSRFHDRSQSISATSSNQEPMLGGGILSGAP